MAELSGCFRRLSKGCQAASWAVAPLQSANSASWVTDSAQQSRPSKGNTGPERHVDSHCRSSQIGAAFTQRKQRRTGVVARVLCARPRAQHEAETMLRCFAAADARADGDIIGVGGWIVTATQCAWFAEQWISSEVRSAWPQLTDAPQRYIACFETLAQLALAMTAHRAGAKQWAFSLPTASDNTAAEAKTEKLWSAAEPLGSFLKLTAAWAAKASRRASGNASRRWTQHLGRRAQQRQRKQIPASRCRKSVHRTAPVSRRSRLHYTASARRGVVR